MNVLRRLKRKPAQTLLVLLAVFFGSAAITLSLSAYLGSPQFRSGLSDRFELSAGWRTRDEWGGNPLFVENDLEAVQALAPAVERLAGAVERREVVRPHRPRVARQADQAVGPGPVRERRLEGVGALGQAVLDVVRRVRRAAPARARRARTWHAGRTCAGA